MISFKKKTGFAGLTIALGMMMSMATQASAVIISSGSAISDSANGLTNPGQTITFEEGSLQDIETTFGVTFSDGATLVTPENSFNNFFGIALNNVNAEGAALNPFVINFKELVSGAAFNLVTVPAETTFAAFRGGEIVGVFSADTSSDFTPNNNFFGFENVEGGFNQLGFFVQGSEGEDATLDNLQFTAVAPGVAAVPEPGTMSLMGLGLAALGAARRRKKLKEEAGFDRLSKELSDI